MNVVATLSNGLAKCLAHGGDYHSKRNVVQNFLLATGASALFCCMSFDGQNFYYNWTVRGQRALLPVMRDCAEDGPTSSLTLLSLSRLLDFPT